MNKSFVLYVERHLIASKYFENFLGEVSKQEKVLCKYLYTRNAMLPRYKSIRADSSDELWKVKWRKYRRNT